jgi:prepilin-type processing-associated H-X9-DG protein
MNIAFSPKRERGLTLLEIFVILAVISILAALLIPALLYGKVRAQRITCDGYLKGVGLAYPVWESDHKNLYPMAVARTNGGTMDFITGPNAWRHFQVMSNELSTPRILICPAESDHMRSAATNFNFLRNPNLSYFVGLDANEINPQLILAGDRNITNGTSVKNGVLDVSTNNSAGWTAEMHNGHGNMALADGSVQQVSILGLRTAVTNTGLATNRLQMPVLTP